MKLQHVTEKGMETSYCSIYRHMQKKILLKNSADTGSFPDFSHPARVAYQWHNFITLPTALRPKSYKTVRPFLILLHPLLSLQDKEPKSQHLPSNTALTLTQSRPKTATLLMPAFLLNTTSTTTGPICADPCSSVLIVSEITINSFAISERTH